MIRWDKIERDKIRLELYLRNINIFDACDVSECSCALNHQKLQLISYDFFQILLWDVK